MSALKGWHPGEIRAQKLLGCDDQVATHFTSIVANLPPDHAQFYEMSMPFVPVTTLDEQGRPWGSILAGAKGEKGFMHNQQRSRLAVKAQTWKGDPLGENLQLFGKVDRVMISGIGIEYQTRQRNKFAGWISKINQSNHDIEMDLLVNQAIGHCPKYITSWDLEPRTERQPKVEYDQHTMSVEDRLPDDAIKFIQSCDTAYIGTSYVAAPEYEEKFPSHVAMNHRGGMPGFTRVRNDGRTLVLPDYTGNHMLASMGNIEITPLASMTFVNFVTGDILYTTGTARNVVGSEAEDIMPQTNALTLIHTNGFTFVRDALPIRQKAGKKPTASPYSPPLQLLTEESSADNLTHDARPNATLSQIKLHDPYIGTFTWETSKDLDILPGQSIILDCSSFINANEYQRMTSTTPSHFTTIRTWTVSSESAGPTRHFSLTLRHKPGGAMTTALFNVAQRLVQDRKEFLEDTRPLGLTMKVAGITGHFTLPEPSPSRPRRRDLVWFAGGIGFTPFLSFLKSLRNSVENEDVNIRFMLSTREANILLPLIFNLYTGTQSLSGQTSPPKPNHNIRLIIDVLHSQFDPAKGVVVPDGVALYQHARRLDANYIESQKLDLIGRDIFICGPGGYAKMVVAALGKSGVDLNRVRREGFSY